MATAGPPAGAAEAAPPEREVVRVHRHRGRTALKWTGIGLGALVLLLLAAIVWINSDPGRRYIVRQINNIETATGLRVSIGRLEGSIFGELVIHDLRLSDPDGVFFQAPRAELDYRPLAYFRNHIDIRSLVVPEARLLRLPQFRPGEDPDAPLLPDIDIDIGRLAVARLHIDPAVTGQRHLMSLDGSARIADGRAQVALDAGTVRAPGLPGGDRLVLRLDAVPDADRLDLGLRLTGPGDGFVAGLAGVDRPIAALVTGRGSWSDWQGRARAGLGGEGLLDLAIGAQNGTFTIRGPVRPGLVVTGPLAELTAPMTQVNLVTTFENRRADLRLRMNSRAAAIAAEGLVDLGQNRFENLRVAARVLQPSALAPDLSARNMRLALVLNGRFATPQALYDLQAEALTFDQTTLEGFRARGRANVRENDIVLPISATARRITGLDPALGGLLTNVALDGTLGITGPRIVSDNLRIRSDRVAGTLALALDFSAGRYLAALQGRVNGYEVDGVGLFDLDTNVEMLSTARGFGLRGRIAARSRRIDNATARDFLAGPATVSANFAVEPSGLIRLDAIRLTSPGLRITSGSGNVLPDGRIDFRLAGVSRQYGPLTVWISGTPSAPQVRLEAASPGFGVGLRNVAVSIRPAPGGWAIVGRGDSAYGPFDVDAVILTDAGPLTIQLNRLTFAGFTFSGRIVQGANGVFTGTLAMSGQGLDGTVRLAAEGGYQRIDVAATADNARIPGETPILVRRGIIRASAVLYPDAPAIVGDAQLAGLSSGNLSLDQARARIDYRGGRGTAQLLAEGSSGVPFRVAANAALAPDLIRAALQGQANGIPFRTVTPAEVRPVNGGWQLAPVTVALPQGQVRLAGRYGNGLVVQSRLDNLNLAMFNALSPGLGLGGRATGSLDFAQPADGSFPRAEARITVENFSRTGLAGRSLPVNLALAGTLQPDGGNAGMVIRRGGAVIGRAQARLQPLGPGAGAWTTRLLAAPLQGGIRYNGPADVLVSLAGLAGHQVTGPIGVAADFSGRVQNPQFTGLVRANALTYVNEEFGTRIDNLALTGRFTGERLEIVQLQGRAGEGTVTGRGTIGLAAAAGFPIDLRLAFQNARLARSEMIGATATGELAITNSPQAGARIAGQIALPELRYQIVQQGAAEVPVLAGVRRRGEPVRPPSAQQAENGGVPSIWQLDLRVFADNRVFVSGMGLESEWSTDLRIGGTSRTPRITGNLELIRGTLGIAGRRFELRDGDIAFTGSRPPNPLINLVAVSNIDGVEVSINVGGSASDPQIAFASTPGLPQDEIVSRILFGTSVTQISALQAVQLAASLNSLRGGGGGLNPLGQLRSATGIDRLRILGADQTTGRGTAVAAGMYLSNDIYVEIITDARGFTATQLEIALSRTLSVLSQFGSTSGTAVNVRYSRDY
jgi:translocation and assembly module TamB